MKKRYYKLGETFQFGNVRLRVADLSPKGCEACYFYSYCMNGLQPNDPHIDALVCTEGSREDGRDVVFMRVENKSRLSAK